MGCGNMDDGTEATEAVVDAVRPSDSGGREGILDGVTTIG